MYKRYHVSLDNRVSFSSAVSESRRLFSISVSSRSTLSGLVSFRAATMFRRMRRLRYASLCLYLSVWIIVSPLPPRFWKRNASSFDICLYSASANVVYIYTDVAIYARVVVCAAPVYMKKPLPAVRGSRSSIALHVPIGLREQCGATTISKAP